MIARSSRRCSTLVAAVTALALAACGGGSSDGEVLVSAAASLTDAFEEIEEAFERTNPDIDVIMNLGGSSALREQILSGAPVDVFASANPENMEQVAAAELLAGDADVFVTNRLQVAVPAGNPAAIEGITDFGNGSLLLGLCAEGVPCGIYGRKALEKAGINPTIDTAEPDVRALLNKIELGELDAGIVYVTDVASTDGGVEGIDIAESQNAVADYPIATLADAPNPEAAARFVAFVLSEEGASILRGFGFSTP